MKAYIGILAILGFIFYHTNKNYEGENKINKLRAETEKIYKKEKIYTLFCNNADSAIKPEIEEYIEDGIKVVEDFFGKEYQHFFGVYLFENRQLLDSQWQTAWKMPEFESQCWMVASGTADRLDILSPLVWKQQACEHNYENKKELRKLIIHEMVHVYQGQHNPKPDFEGMDQIGWFVEGIAVLVSEQYDSEREKQTREAITNKLVSNKLEDLYSGKYRYALSGSIVKYIDEKYGRKKIVELLKCTGLEQILSILNISENNLLYDWQNSFLANN